MDLPAALRQIGIDRLEICSFHIAAQDAGFLAALRSALADADVTLQTLLVDDGDITDPVHRQRDIAWIGRWIDVAAALGAERARVIARQGQAVARGARRGGCRAGRTWPARQRTGRPHPDRELVRHPRRAGAR